MAKEKNASNILFPTEELFGRKSIHRILIAWLANKDKEYNISQLIEIARVSKQTLYNDLEILEKFGLIEVSNKIGHIKLYKLSDTMIIKDYQKLNDSVIKNIKNK